LCELICSLAHEKEINPELARIKINEEWPEDKIIICRQCIDAPCINACPNNALYRDPSSGVIFIDEAKCSGCGACIKVCEFEAIFIHPKRKVAVKCDTCNGNYLCANYCLIKAIELNKNGGE
jgi:Fe-S-cluster-containing hydrogenase component 2